MKMHLAHFGTFDVKNYGDLLFPRIAEHKLGDVFTAVTHISPVGGQPYRDVPAAMTLRQVRQEGMRFDAVLIGGGNIVHARPSGLVEYASVRRTAYPALWAGAAELARAQGIPIATNAPGVPRSMKRPTATAMRLALRSVDYLAVRDQLSADHLSSAGLTARVMLDSALQIDEVFGGADDLRASFEGAAEGLEHGGYAAVHINDRYADGTPDAMAAVLDELSRSLDMPLHLLAIGPCHGDDAYAREVAALMTTRPRVWDRLDRVQDIAAVLANAAIYIGSSLHGFITASSYGVPALLVTDTRAQHKFIGLLEQLGIPDAMFGSWGGLLTHVRGLPSGGRVAVAPDMTAARIRLDTHWTSVRSALTSSAHAVHGSRSPVNWPVAISAVNFLDEGLPAAIRRRLA
jgi:polysaccharide pyruvyl transferase WcaK-like protein